jgi:hypothetical protein
MKKEKTLSDDWQTCTTSNRNEAQKGSYYGKDERSEKSAFFFFFFFNIVCDTQVMHLCILKKKEQSQYIECVAHNRYTKDFLSNKFGHGL